MAITGIKRGIPNAPCDVHVDTSDSLNTITTSGYITGQADNIAALNNGAFEWLTTDIIFISYSDGVGTFYRNSTTNAFVPIAAHGGYQSFTPTVSFATPGDLSVTYLQQVGRLRKAGSMNVATINIAFTATHTTAAGSLFITMPGMPTVAEPFGGSLFEVGNANLTFPAGRTSITPFGLAGGTNVQLIAIGSATADIALGAADITTATAYVLGFTCLYA